MIFCQAVKVDWQLIHHERLKTLTLSNTRENSTRIPYDYSVGDQVLIVLNKDDCQKQSKLSSPPKVHSPLLVFSTTEPFNLTEMVFWKPSTFVASSLFSLDEKSLSNAFPFLTFFHGGV
jgi:hypothetical protein